MSTRRRKAVVQSDPPKEEVMNISETGPKRIRKKGVWSYSREGWNLTEKLNELRGGENQ